MTIYFSKKTRGFYNVTIHGNNMPADVVKITNEEHAALLEGQSQGKLIDFDEAGRPVLVDPAPHKSSRAEIEAMRLRAYADPLTGSDRFFSEAVRLQVMGADAAEIEKVKALGADRFAEIQSEYPWPQSEE